MTREEAARFPYGSAGINPISPVAHRPAAAEEPQRAVADELATAEQLKALADFVNARRDEERRAKWRHAAGLDGNQHGHIIHELKDTL